MAIFSVMSRIARLGGYWPIIALPTLGLIELSAHVFFTRWAPSPEEWAAIGPRVTTLRGERDDVVVVEPRWAEPIVRWKLGDAAMPLRDVARPDPTRYARAIEVSSHGAHSDELRGWLPDHEERVGKVVIRVLRNPAPVTISYDFTDHVQPPFAEAEIARGPSVEPCPWTDVAPFQPGGLGGPAMFPNRRFRCGPGLTFNFVGVTLIEDQHDLPRRCIWLHPPSGGETVVRFRRVPLGSMIHGHMGIAHLIERGREGKPISVRIVVDGDEIARSVHNDGDGWKAFEIPLGERANRSADVEFRSSSASTELRQLCLAADTR